MMSALACDVVVPSNRFDPETPTDKQAPATLKGRIVLADPFAEDTRLLSLAAVRIGLLDDTGSRLRANGSPLTLPLVDIETDGEGRSSGHFVFDALEAGQVTLVVENPPARYQAPTLPSVALLPGAVVDLGELVYAFEGTEEQGPGRISGEVRAEGGANGQHRVTLLRRDGGTTVVERSVFTEGAFEFTALPLGNYAVMVEGEGNTPVYRLGVQVAPQEEGEARLEHQYAGDEALVVHPISAALQPAIGDETVILDEGAIYIRGESAPMLVLPFVDSADIELGITGMRLSARPDFLDDSGAPISFVPHRASTAVPLPALDGRHSIYAQFEARSPDDVFMFISPTVSIDVIKDTTPPTLVGMSPLSLLANEDGVFLSPSRSVAISVDASDAVSGVDAAGIALNAPPEALEDLTASPGLQRFQRSLTADDDGAHDLYLVLEDRAGNRSDPFQISLLIDTVAPEATLVVQGAEDGLLRSRVATLELTSLVEEDTELLARVGLEGTLAGAVLEPAGLHTVILPTSLIHGAPVTFEAELTDPVGNTSRLTQTVALDLRGALQGTLVSEGVPGVLASVAGAEVTLSDGQGMLIGTPVVVDGTGVFSFPGVPEGRNIVLQAALAGHLPTTQRSISVDTDQLTDLGNVSLSLLRGEVRGIVRRGDLEEDVSAHAGISVSLALSSPQGRTYLDTVTTDAAGQFSFRDIPQTLPSEKLVINAFAPEYGSASQEAFLTGPLTTLPDATLPRIQGDFDLCRAQDSVCAPALYFSQDDVDIRLRDATDVVALWVGLNDAPPVRIELGVNNRTRVSFAGLLDGDVSVNVRAENGDGSQGEVLSATVVRDTAPPAAVSLTRHTAALARDARFTRDSFVDVTVTADAGTGVVAPLGTARLVIAASAPALPDTGYVSCQHGATCRITLPNDEGVFRFYAFSCDVAGNCAEAEEGFVIRDVTPPSSANGVAFSVTAPGAVAEGGTTILPTSYYLGVLETGTALTAGGTPLQDETGASVADVYGFRFSLNEQNLPNVTLQAFSDPPLPGETRTGADIIMPALPAGGAEQTVYAGVVDAAGNVSQSQLSARVRIDDTGPDVLLVLNGGAPTADTSIPFAVDTPVQGEAATDLVFVVDDTAPQSFSLPLDGTERLILPTTEGLRRVTLRAYDLVGNETRVEQSVLLDMSGPRIDSARCVLETCVDTGFGELLTRSIDGVVSLALVSYDAYSAVTSVEVTSTPASPLGVQTLAMTGGAISGVAVPLNQTASLTLTPIDALGNRGEPFVRAVRHDTEAPVIAAFTIEAGAERTRNTQVTLQIDVPAGDAATSRLAETSSFSGVPQPFRNPDSFIFSGNEGTRQVCVEVRDAAGNASSACDSIVWDKTAPSGNVSTALAVTADTSVAVTLTYPADTTQVSVSTDSASCDLDVAPYVTATGSPQLIDVPIDGEEGPRLIYACFADAAGNIGVSQDTVILDRTRPYGAISLNDDAAFTTDPSEDVTVTATMASDATRFALVETTNPTCETPTLDCATATYETFVASVINGQLEASKVLNLGGAAAATEGPKCVEACFEDAAGNRTATPALAAIVYDKTAPSVSGTDVTLQGTPAGPLTRSAFILVTVANAPADTAFYRISEDNSFGGNTQAFVPFSSGAEPFQLSGGDGQKTVYVQLRDQAGNVGLVAEQTITLDETPPEFVSVQINQGESYTRSTSVDLAIFANGATEIQVVLDGVPDTEPFVAYATSSAVTLPTPDGSKLVVVRFKDAAGNISTASDTILLDRSAPVGGSVVINDGAAVTRSTTVQLAITPPSDATSMSVAGGPFIPVSAATLSTIAPGDCVPADDECKTVSVVFRDAAGNVGSAVGDAIGLDTLPPSSVSVSLTATAAGATPGYVIGDTGEVDVSFSFATGAGNATSVKYGEGAIDCATEAGYVALAATSPEAVPGVLLSLVDGQKTYVACFKDDAGNVATASTVITMDRQAPYGSIQLNGGDLWTSSANISVAVTAGTGDVERVALVSTGAAPDCQALSSEAFVGLETALPHTLSGGDAIKTVYACFEDVAGNRSQAPAAATIRLDTADPTLAFTVQGNADADPNASPPQTNTRVVTVTLTSLSSDATGIAIAEGALACGDAAYEALPGTFTLPFTRSFTLSPGTDGTRDVRVCARDDAGNVNALQGLARQIILDTTPPQVSAVIAGGAEYTTTRTVSVGLSATPTSDLLKFFLAPDPAVDCAQWTATQDAAAFAVLPASAPLVFSTTPGEKYAVLCAKDRAGNTSRATDTIVLDTERPTASFSLDGGAEYSLDNVVTANFTDLSADVVEMALSKDPILNCAGTSYVPFVEGANVVGLSEGTNNVFACLRDDAGNVSDAIPSTLGAQPYVASIVVDTQNPSLSTFSILRLNGLTVPGIVDSVEVRLALERTALSGDAVAFAVGNNALDCSTASYEAFASPLPAVTVRLHTLEEGADGTRTVTVCVKDAAGRTGARSETVTVDTTPPQVSVFEINDGEAVTGSAAMTLTLASTPSSDPLRYLISGQPNCSGQSFSGAFAPLPASIPLDLSAANPTEGTIQVYGCMQDQAGNVSVVSDEIVLDQTAPLASAPRCVDCVEVGAVSFTKQMEVFVRSDTVSVDATSALTVVSNDAFTYADRECSVNEDCGTHEVCRLFPTLQPAGEAPRCVGEHPDIDQIQIHLSQDGQPLGSVPPEGVQGYAVAYVDAAGNVGTPQGGKVVRDVTFPEITFDLSHVITNQAVVYVENLAVDLETLQDGAGQLGTFQASVLATFADAAPLPYLNQSNQALTEAIPVTLGTTEGVQLVRVRFLDNVGQEAAAQVVALPVIRDTTAPTDPRFAQGEVILGTSDTHLSLAPLAVTSSDHYLVALRPYQIRGVVERAIPLQISDGGQVVLDCPQYQTTCDWDGITAVDLPLNRLANGENRLQVVARDTAGNESNADYMTVRNDQTAPEPPTNLTASERSGSVTLAWTPSVSADVAAYEVSYGYKDPAGGVFALEGPSPIAVNPLWSSLTLSGLTDDTEFRVAVTAIDEAGNRSTATAPLTVLPNPVSFQTIGLLDRGNLPLGASNGIVAKGPRVYAKKGAEQLCTYDVEDPTAPVELTCSPSQTPLRPSERPLLYGRFAYLPFSGGESFRSMDISNPAQATAPVPAQGDFQPMDSFAIYGPYAVGLRTTTGGVSQIVMLRPPNQQVSTHWWNVVDVHDHGNGILLVTSEGSTTSSHVAISGGAGVVVRTNGPTHDVIPFGIDLTSESLELQSLVGMSLARVGVPRAVRMSGFRVYVGTDKGLTVYSVTPLPAPATGFQATWLGAVGGFDCNRLQLGIGYAYCAVADSNIGSRLVVIDTQDPANLKVAGRVLQATGLSLFDDIALEENLIYATRRDGKLEVLEAWVPNQIERRQDVVKDDIRNGYIREQQLVVSTFTGYTRFDGSDGDRLNEVMFSQVLGVHPTYRVAPFGGFSLVAPDGYSGQIPNVGGSFAFRLHDSYRQSTSGVSVPRPTTGPCASPASPWVATRDVVTHGNLALVSTDANRVEVWDLGYRNNAGAHRPLCRSAVDMDANVYRLSQIVDQRALVATLDGEVWQIDLNDLNAPTASRVMEGLETELDGFGDLELRSSHFYVSRSPEDREETGVLQLVSLGGVVQNFLTDGFGGLGAAGRFLIAGEGIRSRSGVSFFASPIVPSVATFTLQGYVSPQAPREILVSGPVVLSLSEAGISALHLSR